MPIIHHFKSQTGSTLIEVLIATIVVGVILTGVVGALTSSLKNSSEAQNRQVATRLAQEALELFNQQKAISSWSDFYDMPSDSGDFYCVPTTSLNVASLSTTTATIISTACKVSPAPGGVNTTFYRGIKKTYDATVTPPAVEIKAVVQWQDGSSTREATATKKYFRY